jgi:AhpD family alkylhydroperoxidase
MEQRLDVEAVAPEAMEAVLGVEAHIRGCGLEPGLIHLVKMRASQINGCAFCLDMHSHDARQGCDSEQHLYLLDAWRDVAFDSPRASGTGLDRGADPVRQDTRPGRRVRRTARAFLNRPIDAGRPDQSLEPSLRQPPHTAARQAG